MSTLTFDRSQFECVTTPRQLSQWERRCRAAKSICFDTETTGLEYRTCDLVGFSLGIQEGNVVNACYIPVGHQKNLGTQLPLKTVLPVIRGLVTSGKPIIGANLLFDMLVMSQDRYSTEIKNVHDTQRMSYALTGNQHLKHGMDALAERILGYTPIAFDEIVNPKVGVPDFSYVRLDTATLYAAEDSAVTLVIARILQQQLKANGLWDVYDKIDRPLLPALRDMKWTGVKVDFKKLDTLRAAWQPKIDVLERRAHKQAGRKFNLNSPTQVADVLFRPTSEGGLGITPPEETDGGDPSTAKDALEQIYDVPVVETLLEWRGLNKLVTTYVNGLPKQRNEITGRVHTDLKDTTVKTRRFASAGPNLQNIPTRTDEGAMLRECFITDKGFVLISADYSQIEYRILAHVTGDPTLLQAYRDGVDLHAKMSSDIYGNGSWQDYNNKADKARYKIRAAVKNVNFAVIYGAGPKKIAHMSKIELNEALRLLDAHQEMCPRVYDWKDETWNFARDHNYVQNLFGGRTHLQYINSRNRELRGSAERLAINAPIQGGAAELIRLAIPSVNRIENARLLLQVHDELVLEAPIMAAKAVTSSVKCAMETAADDWIDWRVPIIAETGIGKTWRDAK